MTDSDAELFRQRFDAMAEIVRSCPDLPQVQAVGSLAVQLVKLLMADYQRSDGPNNQTLQ